MKYLSRVDLACAVLRMMTLVLLVFSTGCASMMVSEREPERFTVNTKADLTVISSSEEGRSFSAKLNLAETGRSSNTGKMSLPSVVCLTSQDPNNSVMVV